MKKVFPQYLFAKSFGTRKFLHVETFEENPKIDAKSKKKDLLLLLIDRTFNVFYLIKF